MCARVTAIVGGPKRMHVVVADHRNDPVWVAADLLSQAEHDAAAQSILITDDPAFADKVVELRDDALVQSDVERLRIGRDHQADIGAEPRQRRRQGAADVAETASLGEREGFGGDEQDARNDSPGNSNRPAHPRCPFSLPTGASVSLCPRSASHRL